MIPTLYVHLLTYLLQTMIGSEIYKLASKLWPIDRSLTGKGVRETLKQISMHIPEMKIKSIKSGTEVFDWIVPQEWTVNEAYIIKPNGDRICDFKKNNLHLVGYSYPQRKTLSLGNLQKHLHSIPDKPRAIPYVTSYYKKNWGFCSTYSQKKNITNSYKDDDKFKVVIDSSHKKEGSLTYGELTIKGKLQQVILISTYLCHPSMANNELSGPIVSLALIEYFQKKLPDKTLKFIFIPETIGSITYLNKNLNLLKKRMIGGFNLSCIGDEKNHSCMLSKYGKSKSDKALLRAYKKLRIKYKLYSYLERGSDERQYNSPGIDLGVSSIFRSKYNTFSEYHTSHDNFKLVTKKGIYGGYKVAKTAIEILLKMQIPKNLILCEPQMSKKNLYHSLSNNKIKQNTKNIMNFLQFADGSNELKEISKYIKCNLAETKKIYDILLKKRLIL